jgi:hypothetical protein
MSSTAAKPPVSEEVVQNPFVASWAGLSRSVLGTSNPVEREYVPELRWPQSIATYTRMSTDTQLSGLYRGTALPIRRYVWGLDPNGANPEIVEAVLEDFNLQLIADAWASQQGNGAPKPVRRARNTFTLDRHWLHALNALRLAHAHFYPYGQIGDDGRWHPLKISLIPQWTISQIASAENGDLVFIRQNAFTREPLDGDLVIPYVNEPWDDGDWVGRSSYRSCFREWMLKDRLLRVDLRNHEKGGGVLLPIAPENATAETRKQLGELATAYAAGGGGSLPAGTNPVFIRSTGSDVIASIDRHDAAMAREFLMMFMSLGTNNQSGNRALGSAFIDWFSIAQEATAVWLADVFNKYVIGRYIEWNWGEQDYEPKLTFRRPEQDNPVVDLANAVTTEPGQPAATAWVGPDGRILEVAGTRTRLAGGIVVDPEDRAEILAAYDAYEQWARPRPRHGRAVRADLATVAVPDRPLRRQPYEHEVLAAVDFKQIDADWKAAVARLVASWQQIRARQVAELQQQIRDADGDLARLATIQAAAAGGDLIAKQLTDMARRGVADATAEAHRQGAAITPPDIAQLETALAARAAALEQLLTSALSQAAANKAVQLSGGSLTAPEVASEVAGYIAGLSDSYLTDQFGGALSAAQNGGRLAVMQANQPARLYASELLDENTCEACAAEDGTEFDSPEAAAAAYPAGGFRDCQGGPRCRGTVVAVYAEATNDTGGTE